MVKAFLGVVVFACGLEIGGEGFAQRLGEIAVLYPGVLPQVPIVSCAGGVGQEVLQGDRYLRVLGISDVEGKDLVDVRLQ